MYIYIKYASNIRTLVDCVFCADLTGRIMISSCIRVSKIFLLREIRSCDLSQALGRMSPLCNVM